MTYFRGLYVFIPIFFSISLEIFAFHRNIRVAFGFGCAVQFGSSLKVRARYGAYM